MARFGRAHPVPKPSQFYVGDVAPPPPSGTISIGGLTITAQPNISAVVVIGGISITASSHIGSGLTFSNSATQLEAGNDGGDTWDFFTRFDIPSPSIPSGVTVTYAALSGTVDQTDSGASLIVYAEKAAAPTAPTSNADFWSRTRTTECVRWAPGSITSGQAITSPDLTPIIQELVTAFPDAITAIQLFVQDNSSPLNGKMLLRSFENTANEPASLTLRWHN